MNPPDPTPRRYPMYEDAGLATLSEQGREPGYVDDLLSARLNTTFCAETNTGKSCLLTEMRIRLACHDQIVRMHGSNLLAGTWPITREVRTLLVHEQDPDLELKNEDRALKALGLTRADLRGKAYRQPLYGAALGKPVLMDQGWLDETNIRLMADGIPVLLIDTATRATQIDPWGPELERVFDRLAGMHAGNARLAIGLSVYPTKPANGRSVEALSRIVGDWAKVPDIVLMMWAKGKSPDSPVVLQSRKRLLHQRDVEVIRANGIFIPASAQPDPVGHKVAPADRLDAFPLPPGSVTYDDLCRIWDVSENTARVYIEALGTAVIRAPSIPGSNRARFQRRPSSKA